MFTGIVQAVLPVVERTPLEGHTRLAVRFPATMTQDLQVGASVAIEGVCMTVTEWREAPGDGGLDVCFDVSPGTARITTMGERDVGDRVNVERSMRAGAENGGHVVTGHVSGTAEITSMQLDGAERFLEVRIPAEHRRYVFVRGFLALNGASLTVASFNEAEGLAWINLIPETIRQTSLRAYSVGDRMNYEVELQTQITVDTIERCFRQFLPRLAGAVPG
ncbi:riboflavin synthase subunit alpha [Rhizosaccharibacter radicis]|uniref:Riboflavin synthase n=1 Tax=Rhizosaccharibacter radicis TaxID=2782605 RepID=A0ABT1VV55_9PROT|nr:riboflavin synthase subunit alpha [Acetobacteraceae bacterium KSS12]